LNHFFRIFFFLLILSSVNTATLDARQAESQDPDVTRALEYYINGINDFENQEYEQALDKLTLAHLIMSDDPGINYALSDVYLATGDFVNAEYYAQLAAEAEPENKWYLYHLAEIYRSTNRSEQSIEVLNRILKHHPRDLDILYLLAEIFLEIGDLEESNAILDKIIDQRGSHFEVHLRKFQNYNALGDHEKALAELEMIMKLNPGNISTLHMISQYYIEFEEFERAEEILLDAADRKPGEPATFLLLAEIYSQNQEWERLGNTFLSLIENPHINPDQKIELVRYLYLQSQNRPDEHVLTDQTERLILAISEHEPDYGPAQLLASDYFIQQNEFGMALMNLERVNENFPEISEAWGQRMQLLFTLERYDDVIDLSSEANNQVPDDAFIQFFTGAAFMLTDQHESAEEWLELATQSPSQRNFRSVIYSTLADVRHELDKWDETERAFETALRLDRNNHNALNNYAYYLSLREENLETALEMSMRAIDLEPDNAAYLDTAGWIYFKSGDLDNALHYINLSVETGDASAEVLEHLGDVYNAMDDHENAIKWWDKALDLDPDRTYLKERY
jgi:tetratricopeptide (TPR) repeat protein